MTTLASSGVYVKITSIAEEKEQKPRDATYTIKFMGRKRSEGVELNEHVYGFVTITNKVRYAHFNFKRWIMEK